MKLAFCVFKYFPYGGLQRDFLAIANACVQHHHSVDVYTMSWVGEQPANICLHNLSCNALQNHTRVKIFDKLVKKKLKDKNYDLVIGFNKISGLDIYYAADVCYKAKVMKTHGKLYRCLSRYRIYSKLEENVFSTMSKTKILLISEKEKKDFIKYYKTQDSRFHILPPKIHEDRKLPKNAESIRRKIRKKLNIDEKQKLILMIGSGFKTKGLDRSIRALSSLPPKLMESSLLYVIGKDNPKYFIKLAKKLRVINFIKFLGGQDDIMNFLLAGDILVHPAYFESGGMVLIEALAAGLPVLTTDSCGYASYINKANAGFVMQSPFSQKNFNEKLQYMLSKDDLSILKNNAISYIRKHNFYDTQNQVVNIIESISPDIL